MEMIFRYFCKTTFYEYQIFKHFFCYGNDFLEIL